jgi:hypothetical protein
MGYKIIETIDQLKSECLKKKDDYGDFFIVLAGGLARSSKRIRYDKKSNRFDVHNEIDDTFQDNLSEDELRKETMIIEAIEKNAFFQHEI